MAILRGTSNSRFPSFDSESVGSGLLLRKAHDAVFNFLRGTQSGEWESSFSDSGTQNVPGFSSPEKSYSHIKAPSKRRIISQQPRATIFIKKKMFSSLRDNYDVRFMSDEEKLFLRATKLIFDRKAAELSFYENISNVERVFDNNGFLLADKFTDDTLIAIGNLIQGAFDLPGQLLGSVSSLSDIVAGSPLLSSFSGILDPLAKFIDDLGILQDANRRSRSHQFTTWITDPRNPDKSGVGPGVGVLELSMVQSVTTRVSSKMGGGGAEFSFQDPYRISLITDADIEIALGLAVANAEPNRGSSFTLAKELLDRAEVFDDKLNDLRSSSGQSPIDFELSNGQVVGRIVTLNLEFDRFTIGNYIGQPGASNVGTEAFTLEQAAFAKELMLHLEQFVIIDQNNINVFGILAKDHRGVRGRLRSEFLGHCMIQQMDVVHVFKNSRTRDETQGAGPLPHNSILSGTTDLQGDMLDSGAIKTEWEQLAPGIPLFIYSAMRDRSQWRPDGVQTFSGLVSTVGTRYSADDGAYTVSVNCEDNTKYLRMGRFNQSPSIAQPGGSLHDSQTPFKLDVDPATGLVKSEPKLSDENVSRLKYLRYDDGLLAGKRVTEENIAQDKLIGGTVTKFQHCPGLVYKWKKGIIAETLNVNTRRPLNGKGSVFADVVEVYGVTTFQNPFSGLDAADVVSISITGQPHNYATFVKHATSTGTLSLDGTNPNKQYFNYLLDFFEERPNVFGGFIPAKPSLVSPAAAAAAFSAKQRLDGKNRKKNSIEQELATLNDRLAVLKSRQTQSDNVTDAEILSGSESAIIKLKERRDELDADIESTLSSADASIGSSNAASTAASLTVVGNEVLVNFNESELSYNNKAINYRIKKKPEDVRYNTDKNYLVISDLYDSDVDIQAFAKALKQGGPDLFNSEFQSAADICESATKSLGFELFADSQGNIVFRPPEYNKTPLSLLIRMMSTTGTGSSPQMPEFLTNLFESRTGILRKELLLLELEILEQMILLGTKISQGSTYLSGNVRLTLRSSDTITWNIDDDALASEVASVSKSEGGPSVRKTLFSPEQQRLLQDNESSSSSQDVVSGLINIRNAISKINGREDRVLQNTDSARSKLIEEIDSYVVGKSTNASTNRLRATNAIASQLSKRQTHLLSYSKMVRNSDSLIEREGDNPIFNLPVVGGIAAQLSGLSDSFPSIPRYMERLIENDLINEDGWRSGKRFIIYDDVILSMDLEVKTPEFNSVEVTGNIDFVSSNTSGDVGGIPKVLWAGATDFDSWRQYGFMPGNSIFRPDFSSAESQCSPYSVFKLLEQRKLIHHGNIRIVGNEHYQVGDVVYLNNRSMLYYVSDVSHSFDFGRADFTTTLTLTYGHVLGEYIPTPLDAIGKGELLNARNSHSGIAVGRSAVSKGYAAHLDTLFLEEYAALNLLTAGSAYESFSKSDSNIATLNNLIKRASARINNRKNESNRVEIRTYYIAGDVASLQKALLLGQWVESMLSSQLDAVQDASEKIERSKITVPFPINIASNSTLTDTEEKLLYFPSAKAWAGKAKIQNTDGVLLPLNAIDIFYVSPVSVYGDQTELNLDLTAPSPADLVSIDLLNNVGL